MSQWSIAAPVGSGGLNRRIDVYTVQSLLNHARLQWRQPLIGVDGVAGGETVGAISDFQRKSFGTSDGRVDPGRQTISKLNDIFERAPLRNSKTYTHGPYSVTIGEDGRLHVAPRDWLTKYSAAIHDDYWHIFEFARPGPTGPEPIMNYNLIRAGETLIHLPTYRAFNRQPAPPPKNITDAEKKRITVEALKHDFNVPGNYWDFLGVAADYVGYASQGAEFLAIMVKLLGGAADALGLIAVPFEIIGNTIDWANAGDAGVRLYGLRAVAYAITAFAFDEPIPQSSPEIRRNYLPNSSRAQMERLDRFWQTCSSAANSEMERWARSNGGLKNWKATLRAVGNGRSNELSLALMKHQEKEMLHDMPGWQAVLEMWRRNYSVLYKA